MDDDSEKCNYLAGELKSITSTMYETLTSELVGGGSVIRAGIPQTKKKKLLKLFPKMISNPHQSLPTPAPPSTHLIREGRGSTYAGLQEPRWMLAAGRILFCGSCTAHPQTPLSLCGKVAEDSKIGFYGHGTCGRRDETSCTVRELYLNLYSNTPTTVADGYYCKCFVCK